MGAGSKVLADESFADFFPRASSTHAKLLIMCCVTEQTPMRKHATATTVSRSLRKHIMRAHRGWKILTLQCREVQGYVGKK